MMLVVAAPVFHNTVPAQPEAVNVTLAPAQSVAEGEAERVGGTETQVEYNPFCDPLSPEK